MPFQKATPIFAQLLGDADVKGDLQAKGFFVVEGNFKHGGKFEVGSYKIDGHEALIYEIPSKLLNKYKGMGFGFIATKGGQVLDLFYFDDISSDFIIDPSSEEDIEERIKAILVDDRMRKAGIHLAKLGDIHVGFFEDRKFHEL